MMKITWRNATVATFSSLTTVTCIDFNFNKMGAAGGADAAAEKTEFDVELTSAGSSKIKVVKAVKEATGLGLKDAKELVDGAPKVIKEALPKEEAEKLKEQLEEVGATVELK